MSFITQQTRQKSFNDIQEKQPVRYELILEHLDRPKTAKELAVELFDLGLTYSAERNMVAPRLTELEGRNIVQVIGKKKCKYTGKMVAVYQKTEDIEKMQSEYSNHIPRLD